jgi:hypothetical protein
VTGLTAREGENVRREVKLAKEIVEHIYCPDYFWTKETERFIEFRTWLIMRLKEEFDKKP